MTDTATRAAMLACCGLALGICGGWQPAPEGDTRPAPADDPIPATTETAPEAPRPGLTRGIDWLPEPAEPVTPERRVLPEPWFLPLRRGTVVAGPGGHRVFVPDQAERVPGEGAMLLLPNAVLERIVRLQEQPGVTPRVRLTGEVFLYRGRNYLLPTSVRFGAAPEAMPTPEAATEPETGAPAETDAPSSEPADVPDAPASAAADPEVADLLRELEDVGGSDLAPPPPGSARPSARPSNGPTPTESRAGSEADAPAALAGRDGLPLTARRGHIVREVSGSWTFRSNNDTASAAMETPMVLLPCAELERLERRALDSGDRLEVILWGRVYRHGERTYLLPTLSQLPPEGNINARQ